MDSQCKAPESHSCTVHTTKENTPKVHHLEPPTLNVQPSQVLSEMLFLTLAAATQYLPSHRITYHDVPMMCTVTASLSSE